MHSSIRKKGLDYGEKSAGGDSGLQKIDEGGATTMQVPELVKEASAVDAALVHPSEVQQVAPVSTGAGTSAAGSRHLAASGGFLCAELPGMFSICESPALSLHDLSVQLVSTTVACTQPAHIAESCPIPGVGSLFSPSLISVTPGSSSSSEGRHICYSLRSREVLAGGEGSSYGLPDYVRGGTSLRGRGRRSLLSKAQEKAMRDMAAGTQSRIDWALGAAKAQVGVP